MPLPRRDFLKLAAGTAAAAGLIDFSTARLGATQARSSAARGGTPGTMTPEERRALLAKAVFGPKDTATGMGGMVICAHPLATRAGTDILRAGGNAADAARARGLPLEIVNPWNWGLGSFEAIWIDPATGRRTAKGGARRCAMAEAV